MQDFILKAALAAVILISTSASARVTVPDTMLSQPAGRWAARFVDRYIATLEAPASESRSASLRRAEHNGVEFSIGRPDDMLSMPDKADFTLSFSGSEYNIRWQSGAKSVAVKVPAKVSAITLMSTRELEDSLVSALRCHRPDVNPSRPTALKTELKQIPYSDFYISDKGFYILPRLHNQLIYLSPADGDSCVMMIDGSRYIPEALSNMIISGYTPFAVETSLTIKCYGYRATELTIPLDALQRAFADEDSTPYWGLEKYDGKIATGICLWVNEYGGYAHLLRLDIPVDALSKPCKAKAILHPYIRLDNIKSLFEETN